MKEFNRCYNEKYKTLGLEGKVTKMHCESTKSVYSIDTFDILVG